MDARDCAYGVVAGVDHTCHLTGYFRYMGTPAAVIVGPNAERTVVVARFEVAAAENEVDADAVVGYGSDDLLDFVPMRALATACRELVPSSRVAIAGHPGFTSLLGEGLEPVDITPDLMLLRRVKDDDELDRIQAAFELALIGQRAVEALLDQGLTEIELFTAGHAAAQEAAGAPVEFLGALASGSHTSLISPPLHVPGETRVGSRASVLADIAIRHRGYWGDSTRTYARTDEIAFASAVLSTILDEAAAGLRPGRRVAEVYTAMHAAITERLPGAIFPHHGGHGIGIGVGENPQIVPTEESLIEERMVFAIEPGAYWQGSHGARVENTYVVHRSGAEIISSSANTP